LSWQLFRDFLLNTEIFPCFCPNTPGVSSMEIVPCFISMEIVLGFLVSGFFFRENCSGFFSIFRVFVRILRVFCFPGFISMEIVSGFPVSFPWKLFRVFSIFRVFVRILRVFCFLCFISMEIVPAWFSGLISVEIVPDFQISGWNMCHLGGHTTTIVQ